MFYRVTSTVFVQSCRKQQSLRTLSWTEPGAAGTSSAVGVHLIPFFRGSEQNERVQSLTAESVRLAVTQPGCGQIRLFSATLEQELIAVPNGFSVPRPLYRSAIDSRSFKVPRPLPLLFDVLDLASPSAPTRDHLVFSNSDICVQPHFYRGVQALLRRGFDCLIINRRTVPALDVYGETPSLAALETGDRHPGADCFVFPLDWIKGFARSEAYIGMGGAMRSLIYNLVARAESLLILEDAALTYHYGNDQTWNESKYADYARHNEGEALDAFERLSRDPVAAIKLEDYRLVFKHPNRVGRARSVSLWSKLFNRAGRRRSVGCRS